MRLGGACASDRFSLQICVNNPAFYGSEAFEERDKLNSVDTTANWNYLIQLNINVKEILNFFYLHITHLKVYQS